MEQQIALLQQLIDERNALYLVWYEAAKARTRNLRKYRTNPQQYAILKARESGLAEQREMVEKSIKCIASEWGLRLCRKCVSGMYIYGMKNAETRELVAQH